MDDFALYGNCESGHSFKVKAFMEVARVPHRYEEIDLRLARPHGCRWFPQMWC